MKRVVAAMAISATLVCLAMAQTAGPPPASIPGDTLERPFASGGTARMELSAGDYVIRAGSAADKILIRWKAKTPEQLKQAQVKVDLQGSEVIITTHGPKKEFHVEIELPAHTDLHVRLSSGDIDIHGIEGNKNVECHAGDLSMDIGRAQDYSHISASVKIGDIEAPPIGASKGGFFRSIQWPGTGKYTLHAHVGAGSLTLLGTK